MSGLPDQSLPVDSSSDKMPLPHHYHPASQQPMNHRKLKLFRIIGVLSLLYMGFVLFASRSSKTRQRPVQAKGAVEAWHKVVQWEDYQATMKTFLAGPSPHMVLFTSGTYEGTDEPWCPDCYVARPVVRQVVRNAGGSLLEVEVGSREGWRNPQHPLKVDKRAPIKYIPTLYSWSPKAAAEGDPSTGQPIDFVSNALSRDESVEDMRVEIAKLMKRSGPPTRAEKFVQQVIESRGKNCDRC